MNDVSKSPVDFEPGELDASLAEANSVLRKIETSRGRTSFLSAARWGVAIGSGLAVAVTILLASNLSELDSGTWGSMLGALSVSAGAGLAGAKFFGGWQAEHQRSFAMVPAGKHLFTFEYVQGSWRLRATYALDDLPASWTALFADGAPVSGSLAFEVDTYLRLMRRRTASHDA